MRSTAGYRAPADPDAAGARQKRRSSPWDRVVANRSRIRAVRRDTVRVNPGYALQFR
jgi:hypothetical protein